MRERLLNKLRALNDEEKRLMKKPEEQDDGEFYIYRHKYLSLGSTITVSEHMRFIETPSHGHDFVEIMYVCSGQITHIIDGKEIVMSAGDILFMNQNVMHSMKKAGIDDIGINFIILPEFFDLPLSMMKEDRGNVLADFLIGALRINEQRPQYLHFKTANNTAIENLMENIIDSLMNEREEDSINQFTMGLIFLHLLNNIEAISDNSFMAGRDIMADTAIRYINRQYKDANLSELARSMRQFAANMSKIIKNRTGHTFSELLQRKRLLQAQIFLEDTKMSIEEIMQAVGYENSSFFYRRFRENFGMSPAKYREIHQKDTKRRE